ncbi:MAG: hypothetical protein WBX35_14140 [Pseudolabrys sp.]|jgi:hypothetical protein
MRRLAICWQRAIMARAIFGTDAFRRFNAQFTFGSTLVVVQGLQGRPPSRRAKPMWIMVVYTLIVLVGETVTVGIGLVLDRIYPAISLTVSLTLFFSILWFAWILAVRLTEPNAKSEKHAA